jgi:hypothetical protein
VADSEVTRGVLFSSEAALEASVDHGSMTHNLISGQALRLLLGKIRGEGQCRLFSSTHASGVCKTCTSG